jgi:TRAP-type C4-dicarboxylate transport system substrate-binding protein
MRSVIAMRSRLHSRALAAFALPRICVALVFAVAAALCADTAPAQVTSPVASPVTWRMTTEYPESSISGIGLVTFSKLVAERTGGSVTTSNAFDNELKINSIDMPRAAQEGRIAGGDAFVGPLSAREAVFGLPTLPFVVQSAKTARAVNERARPLYEKALAARGLRLLYVTIWPATGLWSDRAIETADDLSKLSMRTYDTSSTELMRAAGANAELLPMDVALAGLRERRLNAFLTSGDGGAGRKLWDFLPYFTAINYAMPISLAFVRNEAFAALSQDMQAKVLAAGWDTEQSQFDLLTNRTAENYARMRANGVRIADPAPAALVEALRRAAESPISAWKARAGSEAVEIAEWAIRH